MAGDIGWARTTGCSQPGNTSIGTMPELKNNSRKHTVDRPVMMFLPFDCTPTATMTVAKPITISTGINTKPVAASQPWLNRRPIATPTAVIASGADEGTGPPRRAAGR